MIRKEIAQFPIIYCNQSRMGKIANGWGCHTTVGNECKEAGIKKALVVTTGLRGTGIVDEILGILNYHGISTEVFKGVTSNPKDHEDMAGYKVFKEAGCDGVVSVGGGSSHDCGKAIRLMDANEGLPINQFAVKLNNMGAMAKIKPIIKRQISVNTTAGTGAENSQGCAFTDTSLPVKLKENAMAPGMPCYTSLNDPLLIRCQPARIAMGTAFDAFTHAYEMYISRIQSEISKAVAYRAVKLIAENIREFVYNRMNHAACEKIAWAGSLGGGMGLNTGGGVGLTHGLGHGISANTDAHHGLANMVVTIPAQRYNQPSCPERFADLAEAMGADIRGLTAMQASDKWFEEVERMLHDLKVETGNLNKQFGFKREYCEFLVKEQWENNICITGNPRDFSYEEVLQLYESLV